MKSFILDTNVLFSCQFIERMSLGCRHKGHRMLTSALVHAERVFQLRRRFGAQFEANVVGAFLDTHGIEIIPFDQDSANRVAEQLFDEFPSDDDWRLAKWQRCATSVGYQGKPPQKPRCPATVDWLIARHILGPDTFLVTEDKGSEFGSIPCINKEDALKMVCPEGTSE